MGTRRRVVTSGLTARFEIIGQPQCPDWGRYSNITRGKWVGAIFRPERTTLTLTAKRIPKRRLRRGNGLETLVDLVAMAHLILGSIVAIGLLLSFTLWGLFASAASMAGAFITWLLFRCLAEHLRLQKKIAGLHFEGPITRPYEVTLWSCGNCAQMLHSDSRCESCGALIEPGQEVVIESNQYS